MTVFWTDFAKEKLNEIFKYYNKKAGIKVAENLVSSIVKHVSELGSHPFSGQIEESLTDFPQQFRYLVFTNYKIIYWVNSEKHRVDVSHVFDTRQNPNKIKAIEP